MKNRQLLAIPLLCLLLSCSRREYTWTHTTQKPTLFEKQHDCEFSYSGSRLHELHAAYALSDHLAVSVGGAWGRAGRRVDSFPIFDENDTLVGSGRLKPRVQDIDFAVGYFGRINNYLQYEFYLGTALSDLSTIETRRNLDNERQSRTKTFNRHLYNRYYLQAAIGKNGKFADYGFTNRISFIDYSRSDADWMWEPSIFLRFGYKNVKMMTQFGLRVNTENGTNIYRPFPFTAGIGLYLLFNGNLSE